MTRRPCLAYVVRRTSLGRKAGPPKEQRRGVRARLLDGTGAIEVELEGTKYMKTGDALADSIVEKAESVMGDHMRIHPEIELSRAHHAHANADGTAGSPWPDGVASPGPARLEEIEARDFPGLSPNVRARRGFYEEELLPHQSVEVVGMIHEREGKLVLSGPVNLPMQVRLAR